MGGVPWRLGVGVVLLLMVLGASGCVSDGGPGSASADRTYLAFWAITSQTSRSGVAAYERNVRTAYAALSELKTRPGAARLGPAIALLEAAEPGYWSFRDQWQSVIDTTGGTASPFYDHILSAPSTEYIQPSADLMKGMVAADMPLFQVAGAFGYGEMQYGMTVPATDANGEPRYVGTAGGVPENVHSITASIGEEQQVCLVGVAFFFIIPGLWMAYATRRRA